MIKRAANYCITALVYSTRGKTKMEGEMKTGEMSEESIGHET